MQSDQLKGMIDRAVIVFATMFLHWLVQKGYIGESDSAQLLPLLVLLPALFWGWWNNRDKALVQSASNVPGTVVVTTRELALATPDQKNIIANTVPAPVIAAQVAEAKDKAP